MALHNNNPQVHKFILFPKTQIPQLIKHNTKTSKLVLKSLYYQIPIHSLQKSKRSIRVRRRTRRWWRLSFSKIHKILKQSIFRFLFFSWHRRVDRKILSLTNQPVKRRTRTRPAARMWPMLVLVEKLLSLALFCRRWWDGHGRCTVLTHGHGRRVPGLGFIVWRLINEHGCGWVYVIVIRKRKGGWFWWSCWWSDCGARCAYRRPFSAAVSITAKIVDHQAWITANRLPWCRRGREEWGGTWWCVLVPAISL